MSSLKPVIHGRDHLPGGADPIPIVVTTPTATSAEEHLYMATTSLAGATQASVSWSHYAGTSLVDVTTDPTKATVLAKGLYIATAAVTLDLPTAKPAGDGIQFLLNAVQFVGPAWPPGVPGGYWADFTNPTGSSSTFQAAGSLAAIMRIDGGPFDYFRLDVFNRTGYSIDVTAGMSLVLVHALA